MSIPGERMIGRGRGCNDPFLLRRDEPYPLLPPDDDNTARLHLCIDRCLSLPAFRTKRTIPTRAFCIQTPVGYQCFLRSRCGWFSFFF